jgi:hypothetical protein
MVEVYRARGELEALVIKGLLESYGIPCVFSSHAASSVHSFAIDGLGEVRVMVSKPQEEAARKLVEHQEQ